MSVCFAQPSMLPRDVEWPKHKDGSSALAPFSAYLCDGEIIVRPSLNLAPLFDGSMKALPLLPDGVWRAESERLYTLWLQRVTCPACLRELVRCRAVAPPGGNSVGVSAEATTRVCDSANSDFENVTGGQP